MVREEKTDTAYTLHFTIQFSFIFSHKYTNVTEACHPFLRTYSRPIHPDISITCHLSQFFLLLHPFSFFSFSSTIFFYRSSTPIHDIFLRDTRNVQLFVSFNNSRIPPPWDYIPIFLQKKKETRRRNIGEDGRSGTARKTVLSVNIIIPE